MDIEDRFQSGAATSPAPTPQFPDPLTGPNCGDDNKYIVFNASPPPPLYSGAWSSWASPPPIDIATSSSVLDCNGTAFELQTNAKRVEWRLSLTDPDAVNALPPTISDMWQGSAGGALMDFHTLSRTNPATKVFDELDTPLCDAARNFWDSGAGEGFDFPNADVDVFLCLMGQAGILEAGTPTQGDHAFQDGGISTCYYGTEMQADILFPDVQSAFLTVPLVT